MEDEDGVEAAKKVVKNKDKVPQAQGVGEAQGGKHIHLVLTASFLFFCVKCKISITYFQQ